MSYYHGETILKVQDVSLVLGGRQILKDVNVDVKDLRRDNGEVLGQIVGFLGPSGIGKTKLFEILAGLNQPTSGQVLINHPLEPVKVGKVGVVQQNYPLFMHRTVRSNLRIAAARNYKTAAEQDARIDEMLTRCKLSGHGSHYPAQLSGGQRQRIAIAQQLLSCERYLLLDEPFSGLDVNMVDEISEMIVEIANRHEHNTIIIVSHDIVSTAAIADTLWLMGREHDPSGKPVDGSKIKHRFDLADKGLAWSKDIKKNPEFVKLINEVRDLFATL